MKIFKSVQDLPENNNYGITIGNFDGVHLGHQFLLDEVRLKCQKRSQSMVVMTFNPHPLVILKGKESFLLNDYDEKVERLRDFGVEYIIEIPFDRGFSSLKPNEFLDQFVLDNKVKSLFLGYDFSFGANKKGNHDFVKDYCRDKDVTIEVLGEHNKDKRKYSSSEVRSLLESGQVKEIKNILGKNYQLKGLVKKGFGRGHKLGFATANLSISKVKHLPLVGVYITETTYNNNNYKSITNIGRNPTFVNNSEEVFIETHLLDFNESIYGEVIKISFLDRLRDEMKFENKEKLIEQVMLDIETRKNYV